MAGQLLDVTSVALDPNGRPYSGAKWLFYESGTNAPAAVYADVNLEVSLGSTVTADSAGRFPPIYLDASKSYRGVLENETGSDIITDVDPITARSPVSHIVSVKDAPFNAKGDGTTDDGPAIQAALGFVGSNGGGTVYVPIGNYLTKQEIKVPSNITFQGAGLGVTIIKMDPTIPANQNVITNSLNNREERTDYNENIHILDMTVDANWPDRDSGSGSAENQGSCVKFSTVKNSSIRRVQAINGILHCIDVMASTYFDNGNIDDNAVGPSLNIVIEDCIARNSKRDDGITTHNSGYIDIVRCQSYFDRDTYGEPGPSQHGIEVDEGSFNVHVMDCYSSGWQDAYQCKGHDTTIPAINVSFTRCIAEGCAKGFHVEHVATVPVGQEPYARNVTIRDCTILNFAATTVVPDPRIVEIRGYNGVLVDNLYVQEVGEAIFQLRERAQNVVIQNVFFREASTRTGDTVGLIHAYASVGAETITIKNIFSEAAQPIPVVRASTSATTLEIDNISVAGSDNTVPCVWMSRNGNDQIRGIRQTGYRCDVYLNADTLDLTNSPFLQKGQQLQLSGIGNPEGNVAAYQGAIFQRTGASPAVYIKLTGNDANGWKQLAVVP